MFDFITGDLLIDHKFCDKLNLYVCVYKNASGKRLEFCSKLGETEDEGHHGDSTPFIIFHLMGRMLKQARVTEALVAGLGTGSIGKELHNYGIRTTYIELSPVVEQMWRKHFKPKPSESVIISDINEYLKNNRNTTTLIIDCYGNDNLSVNYDSLELAIKSREHIVINGADIRDDEMLDELSRKYKLNKYIRSSVECGRYTDCDNLIYSDILINDKLYEVAPI